MSQDPFHKKRPTAIFLEKLEDACEWLNIEHGRAADYRRLLDEFEEGGRSGEHILAYYESCEIVELYTLWKERVDVFPGLKDKIRNVCRKGPILRESETTGSSNNRPRNDAFCFLVAGKFLAADIPVVNVDGIALRYVICESNADFMFRWKESYFDVECKRLQSENQLLKRAEEARDQITQSGRCGIIAIDCSVLCRPAGTVLDNLDPDKAAFRLSEQLRTDIEPKVRSSLSPSILGFILSAKVPAMTAVGRILNSSGNLYRRRDIISSWLVVANAGSQNPETLRSIVSRLENQAESMLSGGGSKGSDVSGH